MEGAIALNFRAEVRVRSLVVKGRCDRGEFVPPGFDAPKACNSSIFGGNFSTTLPGGQNQSGSVVVNLKLIKSNLA